MNGDGPSRPDPGSVGWWIGDRRHGSDGPQATRRLLDRFVREQIELAGVRAEQDVVPILARRKGEPLRGTACIVVPDDVSRAVLRVLNRTGSVRRCRRTGRCFLMRRWGGIRGDLEMELQQAITVTSHLNAAFMGQLRAYVWFK